MIGVIADSVEQDIVREFFELFKTAWEFCRRGASYDVLISSGGGQFDRSAKLIVAYAAQKTQFDDEQQIPLSSQRKTACVVSYRDDRMPIYGDSVTFPANDGSLLVDDRSGECLGYLERSGESMLARVGYDLFGEIRTLLAAGQPAANANMPALELHIAILRDLITRSGLSLLEVPPVPEGYRFIACLTHDVDHPSIRYHQWDHTVLGFVSRAVFGSLRDVMRGRMSVRALLANWAAVLKLPLVQLGLARDFWRDFADRYLKLEEGLPSTFFVIPFKNRPGKTAQGTAPAFRAARYGAEDIAPIVQKLLAAGCEVGLHGIDAWLDSSQGREEFEEIQRLTNLSEIGVRMHWLYSDEHSPVALETAGAAYDSTIGYNGTIGYRAGTTQAYRPLQAGRLLELPLHVMDTALFYPGHLGLSERQAKTLVSKIVKNAVRFGGCLTVNWHDRSLAPERQWRDCYRELVQNLKGQGAWFATGGQAVGWFRKRRSVVFESQGRDPKSVCPRVTADPSDRLPGLLLRIHNARHSFESGNLRSAAYIDTPFDESLNACLCEVGA